MGFPDLEKIVKQQGAGCFFVFFLVVNLINAGAGKYTLGKNYGGDLSLPNTYVMTDMLTDTLSYKKPDMEEVNVIPNPIFEVTPPWYVHALHNLLHDKCSIRTFKGAVYLAHALRSAQCSMQFFFLIH